MATQPNQTLNAIKGISTKIGYLTLHDPTVVTEINDLVESAVPLIFRPFLGLILAAIENALDEKLAV